MTTEEVEKRRKSKYCNISISWKLVDAIDHFIENHSELGYTSRGEFIREAVRQRIFSLEDMKILKELEYINYGSEG